MNTRSLLRMAALAGLVTALAPASARAADPTAFPYYKELNVPETLGPGIGSVILDSDILPQLNTDRTNLRFFDRNGKEVPFLLRVKTGTTNLVRETAFSAKIESFKELPANCVEIIVSRRTNDPVPGLLVFQSAQRNFEKSVSVAGSNDRESWTPLATDQPIFDYTRYIDVRNDRIEIQPGRFVFYRITMSNVAENRTTGITEIIRQARGGDTTVTEKETAEIRKELFRVDAITMIERAVERKESEPLRQTLTIQPIRTENDDKKRVTRVTFGSAKEPIVWFDVQVRDRFFSRSVIVSGTDDDPKDAHWTDLAAATICRVEAGAVRQDERRISMGTARRFRNYRLTIENRDNPPLMIDSVRAEAEVLEALFYQQEPMPRGLFYGGPTGQPAQYDIGAVLAAVPANEAQHWTLGSQQSNPLYRKTTTRGPEGKTVMMAAILVMVVLLVKLIARTTKQIDSANGD